MRILALLGKASYQLRHHEWAGIPLDRWAMLLLLIGAGLFAIGLLPGGLAGVATCGVVLVALIAIVSLASRRQAVVFEPDSSDVPRDLHAPTLEPMGKLLLRATGLFEVEGKEDRYTDLQAYFRTFPTREHAVMAIVPPSKFLGVGRWPDHQIGMWYIFFKGQEIRSIRSGRLSFGWQTRPALLVDLEQVIPPPTSPLDVWGGYRSGKQKPKIRRQSIYLSFNSLADRQTVLNDLTLDALVAQ
jgi:hypothetical protein